MNVTGCLNSYGRTVEIHSSDGVRLATLKAQISPLRYKNKMYLGGVYTDIGFNSEGHYLYIGPPEFDLTAAADGTYLTENGVKYRIDRAEKVYKDNSIFYIWAIIRIIVEPT